MRCKGKKGDKKEGMEERGQPLGDHNDKRSRGECGRFKERKTEGSEKIR